MSRPNRVFSGMGARLVHAGGSRGRGQPFLVTRLCPRQTVFPGRDDPDLGSVSGSGRRGPGSGLPLPGNTVFPRLAQAGAARGWGHPFLVTRFCPGQTVFPRRDDPDSGPAPGSGWRGSGSGSPLSGNMLLPWPNRVSRK